MRKRMLKSMIMLVSGLILGWGLVFVSGALAQEGAAGGGEKKDLSSLAYKDGGPPSTFFDYWSQGGPTMWPLLGSLVWTTAVTIELIIKIRFKYFCPPQIVNLLTQAMAVQDYQKAWRLAIENPCPLSSIFSEAIEKLPQGKEAVETIAGEMAANISADYKIKNAYISLNATIAPLLGLFGTISGMVGAFNSMAYSGAVGDPTKLAGDIGEALITTYAGLVIAIPAFCIFYILANRLRQVLAGAQRVLNQLLNDVDFNNLPELVVTREMKAAALAGGSIQTVPAKGKAAAKAPSQPVAKDEEAAECPQCKAPITVGMKKCLKCGTELEWE